MRIPIIDLSSYVLIENFNAELCHSLFPNAPCGHEKTASKILNSELFHKGAFNKYEENVCFCPHSGYKNCPRRGGRGQKMAKFYPRSC